MIKDIIDPKRYLVHRANPAHVNRTRIITAFSYYEEPERHFYAATQIGYCERCHA